MSDVATTVISVVSLLVSAIAVAIAWKSLRVRRHYADLENVARYASLRPILHPTLDGLRSLKNRIEVELTVRNVGRTTAVIDELKTLIYKKGRKTVWFGEERGTLVFPGESYEVTHSVRRPYSDGGLRFDPRESIEELGQLIIDLAYTSRELPDDVYHEDVIFELLQWSERSTRSRAKRE